jgi:dolichol-phosphate hexosyltransferase
VEKEPPMRLLPATKRPTEGASSATLDEGSPEGVTLAVVIPALNEEESIGKVIDEVRTVLDGNSYAVLIVDGHSTDRTREIASEMGARVILQRTRGYGDALRTGFLYAHRTLKADCVVMMDADLTYNPADIPPLVAPVLDGTADMVVGNRFATLQPKAMTRANRAGNGLITRLARLTLGLNLHDTQCGLRAFRASLVDYMTLDQEGMSFATEMIVDLSAQKARIVEIPVEYRPRSGKTKLNPVRDGFSILGTVIRLVRDTRPLLFFLSVSAILAVAGIAFGLVVLQEYLQTGSIQRIPTLVLSLLLLVGSMQMFSVGLIADMLKRQRVREHL